MWTTTNILFLSLFSYVLNPISYLPFNTNWNKWNVDNNKYSLPLFAFLCSEPATLRYLTSFHSGRCSTDCLLDHYTGHDIKTARCFRRNILPPSSRLLNWFQVDAEVIVRTNCVDYVGSLQGS